MRTTAGQRTGWAALPDNYGETVERGAGFEGVITNSFELGQILAHACGDLSDQEMRLMHFYLADMNLEQIRNGTPYCWKSSDFIQKSLSWSKSKVSRVKASLRDKGFITVHYDTRNRPLEGVGVSLAPFFSQINTKRADVSAAFQERRERFAKLKSEALLSRENEPKGSYLPPIIQTPQYCLNTVPPAPKEEIHNSDTVSGTNYGAIWSSGKNQREFHQHQRQPPARLELNEQQMQRLSSLTALSPKVASLIGDSLDTAQDSHTYFEVFKDVCRTIWPDRNTAEHTWLWAFKRYSWRAVDLLIVAVEDPDIRDGQRWFGHMSTRQSDTFSLKPNFARIQAKITQRESNSEPLSPICKAVFDCVGADAWHCWFKDIAISVEDRCLIVNTGSAFKRETLATKFGDPLRRARDVLELESINFV